MESKKLSPFWEFGMRLSIVVSALSWGIVGITLAAWRAETEPPFAVLSSTVENAAPGQAMKTESDVKRDLGRVCDVEIARNLIDSSGTIHTIGFAKMSHEAIVRREQLNPGVLRTSFPIPATATPGSGRYVIDLSYFCNPWHRYRKPIRVQVAYDIRILTQ